MNWLRVKIYNWLAPLFMPALDECNKKNLEQYYKNQREFHDGQVIMQDRINEWMNTTNRDRDLSKQLHSDHMAALREIRDAIAGLQRDVE